MTVLLGVSLGTRAVRTAQPRVEQFASPAADPSGLVTDIERPLFFRNELIDSVNGDIPHLAAESIGAAAENEPELATGVAYRDPRQADALRAALAGAHLLDYHLVHEVEAVVEYLAATGEARNYRSVALFDLGSSGLTVSVVDLVKRSVTASQRSGEYSGDLLDAYVRNNQLERLGKQPTDPDMALFEKRCRIAKERLSTQDAVCLPDASGMILLSRENFELLITDLLDEAIEFARGVMIGANVPIDAVVLIGGGARMPIVQNRVGPALELPSIVPTEPETVAARGAALAARPHSRTRTDSRQAPDANRAVPLHAAQRVDPASRVASAASVASASPAPAGRPTLPRPRGPRPAPPRAAQPVEARPVEARPVEGRPAAVRTPAPLPAPVRPSPARTEALHAAPTPTPIPAPAPAASRPVPARPWVAASPIETTAAAAPIETTGFESSRFTDSLDEAVPDESVAVESVAVESVAVESVAVESVADTAVAEDVSLEYLHDEQVDESFAASSTEAAEQTAEGEPDTAWADSARADAAATDTVAASRESDAGAQFVDVDSDDGKPVPFKLKNIYWLDADYDDDDGEDDRTRARRRLRTGGVLTLALAAVVAVSGFMLTNQNSPQIVDTSVTRTQTEAPATTAPAPTAELPAPVLPPPAPETTVEPTDEVPETEVYQEPFTPEPVTPEPAPTTVEPAPLPPVESIPPTTEQQPPPLIPGFPNFTLPGFPPIGPPAP